MTIEPLFPKKQDEEEDVHEPEVEILEGSEQWNRQKFKEIPMWKRAVFLRLVALLCIVIAFTWMVFSFAISVVHCIGFFTAPDKQQKARKISARFGNVYQGLVFGLCSAVAVISPMLGILLFLRFVAIQVPKENKAHFDGALNDFLNKVR